MGDLILDFIFDWYIEGMFLIIGILGMIIHGSFQRQFQK
jgi:hypothetical protein